MAATKRVGPHMISNAKDNSLVPTNFRGRFFAFKQGDDRVTVARCQRSSQYLVPHSERMKSKLQRTKLT